MGKSQKAPPPPDYSAVAAASAASSKYAFDLGKEQLDFFKQQYADNKEVSDTVIESALGSMERNDYNAQKDRERYETIFQPLEEQLAKEAQDYATPEKMEQKAGAAEADVAQQFQQARQTATDRLEAFGVDPSQTRAGALDLQSRVAEAAAQASAGNQARNRVEDVGRALRSEAINVGKGYPGQIAQTYGTAQNAGNQGVNTGLATTQSAAATMGTPQGWQGLGNQATGQWGNILHAGYQDQMAQYKANQDQSSGWGGIAGTVLGGVMSKLPMLEEGGAIPAPAAPPAAMIYAQHGTGVPPETSASAGAIPDDVPARLSVGEFIIPEDAARWFGEEKLQKMIMKARQDKANAPAQATMGAAPPAGPPAIQSVPAQAQTAIPGRG